MEPIAFIAIFAIFVWLWLRVYNVFLACWFPHRAKARWVAMVNWSDGRFFKFLRWTSALLLALFSLQAIVNIALLTQKIAH